MEDLYEVVYHAEGRLEASMIRLYLESFGIRALASQESVGLTYGLTVGPLGVSKIYVPRESAADARRILIELDEKMGVSALLAKSLRALQQEKRKPLRAHLQTHAKGLRPYHSKRVRY